MSSISSEEEDDKISVKKCKFELGINNFFSYSEKKVVLHSRPFPVLDYKCDLSLFPNGLIREKSNEYVSLNLHIRHGELKEILELRLGIMSVNNTIDYERIEVVTIDDFHFDWKFPKFIKRCDLLQRKSYLVPSDILTIACTVMVKNSMPDLDSSKYKIGII